MENRIRKILEKKEVLVVFLGALVCCLVLVGAYRAGTSSSQGPASARDSLSFPTPSCHANSAGSTLRAESLLEEARLRQEQSKSDFAAARRVQGLYAEAASCFALGNQRQRAGIAAKLAEKFALSLNQEYWSRQLGLDQAILRDDKEQALSQIWVMQQLLADPQHPHSRRLAKMSEKLGEV